MKKMLSIMLGLSLIIGAASVSFAQDTKEPTEKGKGKGKGKGKDKDKDKDGKDKRTNRY